jgi:4-hydroxy-2-oxoglutarate aldolase
MSFRGVYPPIPTSFDATGSVDTRAITENVSRWMRTGLRGIVALGSNGEAALLDEGEGDAVVDAVRRAMPDDRMLIVGTGRESTRATIAASVRAASLGAQAVLVRTPSFFKSQMTADALVAHYTALADACPVPVLLYNLPGVTGISFTPPVVAKLALHPNIVGMKETSPDLERLGQFVAVTPAGFEVFCGWAPVVYPALAVGAAGAILAVANVVPDACVELFDLVGAGRHREAAALQQRLTPLAQLVTATYGVPGLKLALEQAGYHGGAARPPLMAPPARAGQEITTALRHMAAGA